MRVAIVTTEEIAAAGGVLSAGYYTGRKEGETYQEWLERDELERWVAARIVTLEARLKDKPRKMTALVKRQRELARKELAELRKGLE